MAEEIKHYIKEIQDLLSLKYQEVIKSINVLDPEWLPKGGIHASISDHRFKQLCAKHNVHIKQSTEEGITGTIHKTTDPNTIIVVPDDPVVNRHKSNYMEDALSEYNELNAEDLDPLKIKAQIAQVEPDIERAFEKLGKVKQKFRTVLKHSYIHDAIYLQGLFQPYQFLIVPGNISKNNRKKLGLEGFFLQIYVTDKFNNKLIAFNKDEALYAFIIDV